MGYGDWTIGSNAFLPLAAGVIVYSGKTAEYMWAILLLVASFLNSTEYHWCNTDAAAKCMGGWPGTVGNYVSFAYDVDAAFNVQMVFAIALNEWVLKPKFGGKKRWAEFLFLAWMLVAFIGTWLLVHAYQDGLESTITVPTTHFVVFMGSLLYYFAVHYHAFNPYWITCLVLGFAGLIFGGVCKILSQHYYNGDFAQVDQDDRVDNLHAFSHVGFGLAALFLLATVLLFPVASDNKAAAQIAPATKASKDKGGNYTQVKKVGV